MSSKKESGSYYTPKIVADYLVNYLTMKLELHSSVSILEPSAGDGVFISSIYNHTKLSNKIRNVVAVEKDKKELEKIAQHQTQKSLSLINEDFLKFQFENEDKFSLVIGNPPYIKKSLLSDYQIEKCKEIHNKANLKDGQPKNIWTSFLVRCIEFTNDNGILGFVLPSELLQVKYASELRNLLLEEFERIEIITFNELLFKDSKGQDTLLLIAERKASEKGVFYSNVNEVSELENLDFRITHDQRNNTLKWTQHHLSLSEIELLENISVNIRKVKDFCQSKAGIVTAANDFFIVNSEIVEEYCLKNHVKPIIKNGYQVNSSIEINTEDLVELQKELQPIYVLTLSEKTKYGRNKKLIEYLNKGIEDEVNTGFKTSRRERWYVVPSTNNIAEGFFFRRCHYYPKLVKNNAGVLVTDSAYTVDMKAGYNLESFIYSFYNTLTLIYSELDGRFYGGGVLELSPNEFKELPIPYIDISKETYAQFTKSFKQKKSIEEILILNDRHILKSYNINVNSNDYEVLLNIRRKLLARRLKNH